MGFQISFSSICHICITNCIYLVLWQNVTLFFLFILSILDPFTFCFSFHAQRQKADEHRLFKGPNKVCLEYIWNKLGILMLTFHSHTVFCQTILIRTGSSTTSSKHRMSLYKGHCLNK